MPPAPFRYVALGDSTAAGYGVGPAESYVARTFARLRESRPDATLLNLGRNGATLRDLLGSQRGSQRGALAGLAPDLVTVSIGANDLWRRVPVDEFAAGLDALGRALRELDAAVVVSNLPDLTRAPIAPAAETWIGLSLDAIGRRVGLFNEAFREVARRHELALFDLFDETRVALAEHPEYFGPDGFHPSAEGHAAWAAGLWPPLCEALERRARAARAPAG
ncbi:MAG TPA: SGNH/GDSL hydrolase family protein [Polyangiaceae bacterium]|nr:SGNH/GDSL hydrolase family protein [Polyangiaceae bacterium]